MSSPSRFCRTQHGTTIDSEIDSEMKSLGGRKAIDPIATSWMLWVSTRYIE